ncbi:MAG: hypothetical protein HYR84_09150 [Planctomycetes bacterium]|nr:hypothetical protein [Planctomycetota bacterium]
MRQIPLIGAFLLFAAFSMPLMVGCKPDKPADPKPKDQGDNKQVVKKKIKGALDGIIVGKVKYKGDAPTAEEDTRISEAKDAKDKAECAFGGGKHTKKQEWLIKDGYVENVLVSLKPGDEWEYEIDDKLKEKYKKEVVLNQPFCAYVPHVVGVYAGVQELVAKNDAKITHNTKIRGSTKGNGVLDSSSIAPKGSHKFGVLKKENDPMPVECGMHSWMNGFIVTFDHPYFSVTNEKGEFRIENVPVDAELSIVYWHEATKERSYKTHKVTAGENNIDIEISK